MHRSLRAIPYAVIGAALAACSNSSGPAVGFECLGDTLPTTAPTTIAMTGQIKKNVLSPAPLAGAYVFAFRTGDTTTLAADTSTTPGFYGLTIITGGTPINGYVRVTDSTHITTYAYPARPLAANDSVNVQMVTPTEFGLLAGAAGITPVAGDGFMGVIVANCQGAPLAGAHVTTSPAGTVLYNGLGGVPSSSATSTAADGVAYVANVAAGNVTVSATASGHTLRSHIVNARPDVITLTQIRP